MMYFDYIWEEMVFYMRSYKRELVINADPRPGRWNQSVHSEQATLLAAHPLVTHRSSATALLHGLLILLANEPRGPLLFPLLQFMRKTR
jgi:hypothetical protein